MALGDAYGAGVLGTVQAFALAAVERAPAGPGTGDQERRILLDNFDTSLFATIRHEAESALRHHLNDSADQDPNIAQRLKTMVPVHRANPSPSYSQGMTARGDNRATALKQTGSELATPGAGPIR